MAWEASHFHRSRSPQEKSGMWGMIGANAVYFPAIGNPATL
jgi:hypothetical protein